MPVFEILIRCDAETFRGLVRTVAQAHRVTRRSAAERLEPILRRVLQRMAWDVAFVRHALARARPRRQRNSSRRIRNARSSSAGDRARR